MAGFLTIQRFPKGLLSLLGMQVGGETPKTLNPEVQGMLNLLPFFTHDYWTAKQNNIQQITGTGTFRSQTVNALAVPAGEMWLVHQISAQNGTPLGAGQTVRGFRPVIVRDSLLPVTLYPVGTPIDAVPTDVLSTSVTFTTPLLMRTGDDIGVWVGGLVGGPLTNTTFAQLVYTPIRL